MLIKNKLTAPNLPDDYITLVSLWSMVLVAFPAVYRSIAGWLERYFSFLLAVSTGCFVHLSRTHVHISRTARSEAATAETASIFVIHVCISVDLVLLSPARTGEFLSCSVNIFYLCLFLINLPKKAKTEGITPRSMTYLIS